MNEFIQDIKIVGSIFLPKINVILSCETLCSEMLLLIFVTILGVKYWPGVDETETFGPFVIKSIREEPSHGYVLREFLVSKGPQERKIYHFHFQVSQSPQVRLKMNDKKPSRFQFHFSGVLEAFSMLKK